ncbi:hypothetical protein G7047_29120 [Diaphorobacter sp. HDW4A]|nr:hypothetical protein G7047_29120 [Diaphorobacter sp. HDW4A]
MVFLAITTQGLEDAFSVAKKTGSPVWCGSNAISEEQYQARRGKSLSRFNYALDTRDPDVLASALDTIEQHHPNAVVWVEALLSEE